MVASTAFPCPLVTKPSGPLLWLRLSPDGRNELVSAFCLGSIRVASSALVRTAPLLSLARFLGLLRTGWNGQGTHTGTAVQTERSVAPVVWVYGCIAYMRRIGYPSFLAHYPPVYI